MCEMLPVAVSAISSVGWKFWGSGSLTLSHAQSQAWSESDEETGRKQAVGRERRRLNCVDTTERKRGRWYMRRNQMFWCTVVLNCGGSCWYVRLLVCFPLIQWGLQKHSDAWTLLLKVPSAVLLCKAVHHKQNSAHLHQLKFGATKAQLK